MTRAEEFQYEFNKLDKALRKLARADDRIEIASVIRDLSRSNSVVRRFYSDLNSYRDLRNAIVHQSTKHAIAEPYQDTIDALKELTNNIIQPMLARDISSKPVETCRLEDDLMAILKKMQQDNLTNIPVIDDRRIVGILSEASIVRWVVGESGVDGIASTATKVSDIVDYLDDKNGDKYTSYQFVKPSVDVYKIEDAFSEDATKDKRLSAVFVTTNGTSDELPIGVITAWDLGRIGRSTR